MASVAIPLFSFVVRSRTAAVIALVAFEPGAARKESAEEFVPVLLESAAMALEAPAEKVSFGNRGKST